MEFEWTKKSFFNYFITKYNYTYVNKKNIWFFFENSFRDTSALNYNLKFIYLLLFETNSQ